MVVELLQAVGLNKYEAEAYHALLRHGPLTGYELGKRSEVPLSRSYEILERLAARGLAIVQPGDPPRYAAEAPEQFIARTRSATSARLDALAEALAELSRPQIPAGFWVVRGRAAVLDHARTLIGSAERTVAISLAPAHAAALESELAQARSGGRRTVPAPADARPPEDEAILLVVDERAALVGTLAPAAECQAVASTNPAFVAALSRFFTPRLLTLPLHAAEARAPETPPTSWLDWEDRKHRRLLATEPEDRGARRTSSN